MVHWLTIGHFDPESLKQMKISVLRPLDMDLVMRLLRAYGTVDEQGNAWLGTFPVKFHEGYIACLWLGATQNRVAEDFARRLQVESGCVVADIQHGGIVDLESVIRQRTSTDAKARPRA